jgi:hypothetical protein
MKYDEEVKKAAEDLVESGFSKQALDIKNFASRMSSLKANQGWPGYVLLYRSPKLFFKYPFKDKKVRAGMALIAGDILGRVGLTVGTAAATVKAYKKLKDKKSEDLTSDEQAFLSNAEIINKVAALPEEEQIGFFTKVAEEAIQTEEDIEKWADAAQEMIEDLFTEEKYLNYKEAAGMGLLVELAKEASLKEHIDEAVTELVGLQDFAAQRVILAMITETNFSKEAIEEIEKGAFNEEIQGNLKLFIDTFPEIEKIASEEEKDSLSNMQCAVQNTFSVMR